MPKISKLESFYFNSNDIYLKKCFIKYNVKTLKQAKILRNNH